LDEKGLKLERDAMGSKYGRREWLRRETKDIGEAGGSNGDRS